MNKKIAILRGINVGGKRKILMADLKSLCKDLGWKNVTSYIQSGNLIFNADQPTSALEKDLEKAIAETFGFDVPVIVRTATELATSIANNPFSGDTDINQLHLTFLKEQPGTEYMDQIRTYNYEPDQFAINNRDVFISCAGKYHLSKLSNHFFEKNLNVGATTRNWKTVLKLYELTQQGANV